MEAQGDGKPKGDVIDKGKAQNGQAFEGPVQLASTDGYPGTGTFQLPP